MALTYTRDATGWKSLDGGSHVLFGPDPNPSARFLGDPGAGNMYFGTSTLIAGRETYMGQRMGIERRYFNNGTGGGSDETPAAITWITNSIAAGRIPWASFKLPSTTWTGAKAGSVDTWLTNTLNSIGTATGNKGPVWITFHHEPNSTADIAANGPASDYLLMEIHLQTITDNYSWCVHVGAVLSAGYFQMFSKVPPWKMSDWASSASCDIFGLDIYNEWSPANGKNFVSVDQAYRLGGIAQCAAIDPNKPIAIGEWGVREYSATPGRSEQWMQDAYDYCRTHNVVGMAFFDSGLNSPSGPWQLDQDYQGNPETARLVKFKNILQQSTSKLIPTGGL